MPPGPCDLSVQPSAAAAPASGHVLLAAAAERLWCDYTMRTPDVCSVNAHACRQPGRQQQGHNDSVASKPCHMHVVCASLLAGSSN